MIKTPKSTKIGSFTGSNTTTAIGFGFSEAAPNVYTADFVNGAYKVDSTDSTFKDLFTFNRASKAWLVKNTGLQEYAADVPRFDKGLLIEQKATNYARWSFLPENGEFSRTAGIYFPASVGMWKKSTSAASSLYINSLEALTGDVVGSVCAAAGQGNVSFNRMVFDNVVVPTSKLANTNVFYYATSGGTTANNTGILWDSVENVATSSAPLYFQIEKGKVPSSPIKTTTAPVTRLADILSLKTKATSIKGDWDSTLTLSIVEGKLVHSGYGRIRSLEIN